MQKRFRIIAPVVSFVALGGLLLAQKNAPNELPGTLEKLLRQLQDLQAQARTLQDSLRQMSRESRNNSKRLVVTSPGAPEPPAPPSADEAAAANLEKSLKTYRQAIDLENSGMYYQAVELFSAAIQLDPKNDSALLHRGYSYSKLGNHTEAAADLTKSLSLQPNNSRAYLARANAYAALGQNSLAMLDVNEALVRDPQNPEALLLRGHLRQTLGEHDQAAMDYTVALSLTPDTEAAYLGRAISLRNQGLHPLALADCDNAVRVNPSSPAGYLCRAESFNKTGAPDRAIEQLNQAVVAAQALHQPFTILSDLLTAMSGNRASAANIVAPVAAPVGSEGAAPLPPPPAPMISLAPPQLLAAHAPPMPLMSTPGPAPQTQLGKGDAGYYARLGRMRAGESHFEDAIKAYDQAVHFDPSLAPAYNGRGYARLRLRDVDHAINDFSEAVRLNPVYVNAYQNRSVARRIKGDRQGATEDEQRVKDIFRSAGIPANAAASFIKTSDSRPAN